MVVALFSRLPPWARATRWHLLEVYFSLEAGLTFRFLVLFLGFGYYFQGFGWKIVFFETPRRKTMQNHYDITSKVYFKSETYKIGPKL